VTGSTALTIAADGVGPPEIEDGITHLIANDDNMTQISTTATSFTTQLNFSLFIPASAQWMHINALLDNVAVKVTYLRFTCGGATSGTADVTGIGAAWADTDADISAESGWTACTIDMYTSDGGFAALLNAYTIVLKHAS